MLPTAVLRRQVSAQYIFLEQWSSLLNNKILPIISGKSKEVGGTMASTLEELSQIFNADTIIFKQ